MFSVASFSRADSGEKGVVWFVFDDALEIEGQLTSMVVAPHRRFAARDPAAFGNMVPTIGTVINRMQDEPLMFRIGRKIGLRKDGVRNGQTSLPVAIAARFAFVLKKAPEAQKTLCGDGRCRAVHRLEVVFDLCWTVEIIWDPVQLGSAGIPIGNSVSRCLLNVKITGCKSRTQKHDLDGITPAERFEVGVFQRGDPLKLFGISCDDPRKPARPCGERGIALLRIRAAEVTVVRIEDAFVGNAAPKIVGIPPFALIHGDIGSGLCMIQQTAEKRDFRILLTHQDMPERMRNRQGAQ